MQYFSCHKLNCWSPSQLMCTGGFRFPHYTYTAGPYGIGFQTNYDVTNPEQVIVSDSAHTSFYTVMLRHSTGQARRRVLTGS